MLNTLAISKEQGFLQWGGGEKSKRAFPVTTKFGTSVIFLLALVVSQVFAETPQHTQVPHIKFVNIADSTQGLSGFSQFPAINNRGAVAFVAIQDAEQKVFRSDRQGTAQLASATGELTFFADNVAINAAGIVAFEAGLAGVGRPLGIFTSDGLTTKTIVNSRLAGLPGFGIGALSINESGTVAFQARRNGFRSSLIFTGDGSTLTPVFDTLNSNFISLGDVAINASGEIAFRGILANRKQGLFILDASANETKKNNGIAAPAPQLIDIIDPNNPDFFVSGDPAINDAGIVAAFVGTNVGVEIVSGNGSGITSRTDPTSGFFVDFEHPSINNLGAVAFSGFEANGGEGIFVELTGLASPIAVLQTGDSLFGSTVTSVNVGRFAFNDHFRMVFEYELADGRSGIGIASLEADKRGPEDEN